MTDRAARRRVGRNVKVLGLVSLLTDTSSEMIYPVVPLFLTEVLLAPMAVVGVIEGLAESTAAFLKMLSGRWSDRAPRRLPFVVSGYALAAAARPLLAIATGWPAVMVARVVDRIGKGLRGPPRDALIIASVDPTARGRAFGLHRALDTVGGILGPSIALAALAAGVAYRSIFWFAVLPVAAAVLLLALVREPAGPAARVSSVTPVPAELRRFLWIIGVFALGNSSNAFLLLRARDLGWSQGGVVALYILYNIVHAITSMPLGDLSDRIGRRAVLGAGFGLFAVVYAGFAAATTAWVAVPLLFVYGLYASAFAGAGRAYVAEIAGRDATGTALGLYHAVTGGMVLLASALAGLLWSRFGAPAPFLLGAVSSAAAGGLFLFGSIGRNVERA